MLCWRFLQINVFLVVTYLADTKHLPSYITACRRNDPNLNACATENANKALPYLIKGDKEFKVPSFVPLRLPLIEVYPSPGLSFKLKDISLKGLDTLYAKSMNIDLKNRHISLKAGVKQTVMDSQYAVSGKILSLQIQGEGPAHIVSDNVSIEYSMRYNLTTKNGKEYIDIDHIESELQYGVGNVHYNFENIFGENKLLSDNFNLFLNENAKEIDNIAGATNKEVVNQIVYEVFKVLFRVVPFSEVFV